MSTKLGRIHSAFRPSSVRTSLTCAQSHRPQSHTLPRCLLPSFLGIPASLMSLLHWYRSFLVISPTFISCFPDIHPFSISVLGKSPSLILPSLKSFLGVRPSFLDIHPSFVNILTSFFDIRPSFFPDYSYRLSILPWHINTGGVFFPGIFIVDEYFVLEHS